MPDIILNGEIQLELDKGQVQQELGLKLGDVKKLADKYKIEVPVSMDKKAFDKFSKDIDKQISIRREKLLEAQKEEAKIQAQLSSMSGTKGSSGAQKRFKDLEREINGILTKVESSSVSGKTGAGALAAAMGKDIKRQYSESIKVARAEFMKMLSDYKSLSASIFPKDSRFGLKNLKGKGGGSLSSLVFAGGVYRNQSEYANSYNKIPVQTVANLNTTLSAAKGNVENLEKEITGLMALRGMKITESEPADTERLAESVRTVTEEVKKKTEAFRNEAAVVKQAVDEEISDLERLKKAAENVQGVVNGSVSGSGAATSRESAAKSGSEKKNEKTLSLSKLDAAGREYILSRGTLSKIETKKNQIEAVVARWGSENDLDFKTFDIGGIEKASGVITKFVVTAKTAEGIAKKITMRKSKVKLEDKSVVDAYVMDDEVQTTLPKVREEKKKKLPKSSGDGGLKTLINGLEKARERALTLGSAGEASAAEIDSLIERLRTLRDESEKGIEPKVLDSMRDRAKEIEVELDLLKRANPDMARQAKSALNVAEKYAESSTPVLEHQDEYAAIVGNMQENAEILRQAEANYANAVSKGEFENARMFEDEIKAAINNIVDAEKKLGEDQFKLANSGRVMTLQKQINQWLIKNERASGETVAKMNGLLEALKNPYLGKAEFDTLLSQFHQIDVAAERAGEKGMTFFSSLQKSLGNTIKYLSSYFSIRGAMNYVRDGIKIAKEYDSELTEMRKITGATTNAAKQFESQMFAVGNRIGATGLDVEKSAEEYLRLGRSIDEAKEAAEATMVLSKVGGFASSEDATKSMIAMTQAFDNIKESDISDILVNIGNNFPITAEGIAEAAQRSAAALKTAGNDLYETTALIAAGNKIVQNPESVGAALRTTALRLTGTEAAKKELQEAGEDVEDFVVETKSKIDAAVKQFTAVQSNDFKGISVLDDNGNLRSTFDILLDISNVYKEIAEADKAAGSNRLPALLEKIAGKARANTIASIIQSPDLLQEAYEASQNSQGAAAAALEKQLDSISGKAEILKNDWQKLWVDLVNSDLAKHVLVVADAFVKLADAIGGVTIAAGGFAGAGLIKDVGRAKMFAL